MTNQIPIIRIIAIIIIISLSTLAQDQQKIELIVQTGHSAPINAVAASPNGKIFASAGEGGVIKLWNIASNQELKTLLHHDKSVTSISFSPNNKILASGNDDETVILWDIDSGKEIVSFEDHSNYVKSVVFSPDGKFLASGSWDRTVKLWDVVTGELIKTFSGQAYISSVAFTPDGKYLASGGEKTIKVWNVFSGEEFKTFEGHTSLIYSIAFSPNGEKLISGCRDDTIKLWNFKSGKELLTIKNQSLVDSVAFSPDGKTFISVDNADDPIIKLWDVVTGQILKTFFGHLGFVNSVAFLENGKTLVSSSDDQSIKLWDVPSGRELKTLNNHTSYIRSTAFSTDSKLFVTGNDNGAIKLWNFTSNQPMKTFTGHKGMVTSVTLSKDSKTLFSVSWDKSVKMWDVESGQEIKNFYGYSGLLYYIALSPDEKLLASGGDDKTIILWNIDSGKEVKRFERSEEISFLAFSPDGNILGYTSYPSIKLMDINSGTELESLPLNEPKPYDKSYDLNTKTKVLSIVPAFAAYYKNYFFEKHLTPDGRLQIEKGENNKLNLFEAKSKKIILTLNALDENDWVVTTSDGRFDTNKSLDNIEGLHWIVNDEILNPLPLDVFMRQYYEPNLLQRVLKCNEENSCDKEFKPLPSISEINRVQPKVVIKEINLAKNADSLADVTVEVESVTEDVSVSATDRSKKEKKTSEAFDLRLFRDGQLVGVSTPKDKLAPFIKAAPVLVEQNKKYFAETGKLTNTPEDIAWRKANDIFALAGQENVKRISDEKLEYTFRNVRLPKGQESVDFTAYAFNSDKVKSTTTEPFNFPIPKEIAASKKKGRAFVVSIGVNASETAGFDLQYAANDARKMQEIIGGKLIADNSKYSEVIQIPLISDYKTAEYPAVNTAQKEIIRGVFSLLSGNKGEVSDEILKQIPDFEKIKPVEPEDTLIISFSGHGYADTSGIFYLLPNDIGESFSVKTESLNKTISSDELSLWMQDITASEMIMIIDACHSSAAVQGDGFKPGPMGSRGLGQLAYDKDMKILSATQANNVALELESLKQGLLSYALLQDGIVDSLADSDKDKQLFPAEWLEFAEKRVPQLYEEVKSRKRSILIEGKIATDEGVKSVFVKETNQKSNLNLQQPSVFDFKRRKAKNSLFVMP